MATPSRLRKNRQKKNERKRKAETLADTKIVLKKKKMDVFGNTAQEPKRTGRLRLLFHPAFNNYF